MSESLLRIMSLVVFTVFRSRMQIEGLELLNNQRLGFDCADLDLNLDAETGSAMSKFLFRAVYEYNTRMWASAQRDGRPAEYRWRPLFNAAKFG